MKEPKGPEYPEHSHQKLQRRYRDFLKASRLAIKLTRPDRDLERDWHPTPDGNCGIEDRSSTFVLPGPRNRTMTIEVKQILDHQSPYDLWIDEIAMLATSIVVTNQFDNPDLKTSAACSLDSEDLLGLSPEYQKGELIVGDPKSVLGALKEVSTYVRQLEFATTANYLQSFQQ